jgi:hypothetical protein
VPDAPAWARASHLSYLLVERYPSLVQVFGKASLARWMFERGIPAKALKKAGIRYSFFDRCKAIFDRYKAILHSRKFAKNDRI